MKIGFEMMLWTTQVTDAHRPILEDIKKTGYDGVEIPIFEGTPDDYARLGRMLDDIGLERTAVSIIGRLDQNPLSADPAHRRAGVEQLISALDCCQAMGVSVLVGPLHSTYGHFTGNPPTADEKARARDFHREVGDIAAGRNIRIAIEALNRFECYFANTMDDLAAHVAAVGHPNIKAVYDTFHANIEEADPVAAYTRNAEHVIHVHISENDRGVPGRGHVPWAETYNAIRKIGLRRVADDRVLRPRLAGACRGDQDLARSVGDAGGGLSRRLPQYPRWLGGSEAEDQGGSGPGASLCRAAAAIDSGASRIAQRAQAQEGRLSPGQDQSGTGASRCSRNRHRPKHSGANSRLTPALTPPTTSSSRSGTAPRVATELADLVAAGTKRATASLLRDYADGREPLPRVGDFVVVVDGADAPRFIWRTTEIEIKPLIAVDDRFAFDEGEGDRTRDVVAERSPRGVSATGGARRVRDA